MGAWLCKRRGGASLSAISRSADRGRSSPGAAALCSRLLPSSPRLGSLEHNPEPSVLSELRSPGGAQRGAPFPARRSGMCRPPRAARGRRVAAEERWLRQERGRVAGPARRSPDITRPYTETCSPRGNGAPERV